MRNILTSLFLFTFFCIYAQEFSFEVFFQDALGNQDTLVIGYDPEATDDVDPELGEMDYFGTKMDEAFDVFSCNTHKFRYEDEFPLLKTNIDKKNLNADDYPTAISVFVKSKNFPIKVWWDKTQFESNSVSSSIITDWDPGCWFDCTMGQVQGPFWLIEQDSITFDYVGREDIVLEHNLQVDTVREFFFAFISGDQWGVMTDVEDVKETSFRVYPNPVSDVLRVSFAEEDNIEYLKLYDLKGNCVLETNLNTIDMSKFSGGIYMLEIKRRETDFHSFEKIIKLN